MTKLSKRSDAVVQTGLFNKRITIQSPVDTKTAAGGRTRVWTTVLQTFAHIEPWKGNEYWNAQQVESRVFYKIHVRYRKDINISPDMRIVFSNRIYNIRSITVPIEAQTYIDILCEELQAKGSVPAS